MAKGASKSAAKMLECREALVNTDELAAATYAARRRVLGIQAKPHRWARDDPHRRFDDVVNLAAGPAFLLGAWDRVRHNRGAKTAGVDGHSACYVQAVVGAGEFPGRRRASLKDRSFGPVPVREQMIPKAGGKKRRLGIATIADRVAQASLTLVLEPILEAGFLPCSYGFRPRRRAQDAIAETRYLAARSYEWIAGGDITACFDEIAHPALMDRLRNRIGDKRVLALVKAFLKAGILGQDGTPRDSSTGVPQGGILSPVLANLALSVLDEHIAQTPGGPGIKSGHAILTAGAGAMSALVMLAGRLPADTQALGNVRPPDPQVDRVVDQQRQLGVQLVALQPCPADPLQHLRCWQPRDPLRRAGRRRWSSRPVIRPRLDRLRQPPPRPAHATQHPARV
jgi:RNA-directed DNA polymerase